MSDDWPQDIAEAVFLPRALDQVGKALFPDQWTGRETIVTHAAIISVPTPRYAPASDDFEPPPRSIVNLETRESPADKETRRSEQREQGERERAIIGRIESLNELTNIFLARRSQAAATLVAECEAGRLKSYYLDKRSGELCSMPNAWWRSIGPRSQRFSNWGLDWKNPLQSSPSLSWIFIDRPSLAATIAALFNSLPGLPVDVSNDAEVIAILRALGGVELTQLGFATACAVRELRTRDHPDWEQVRENYRGKARNRWTRIDRLHDQLSADQSPP